MLFDPPTRRRARRNYLYLAEAPLKPAPHIDAGVESSAPREQRNERGPHQHAADHPRLPRALISATCRLAAALLALELLGENVIGVNACDAHVVREITLAITLLRRLHVRQVAPRAHSFHPSVHPE